MPRASCRTSPQSAALVLAAALLAAAAAACLGAGAPPARTGRSAQPPLAVPPPAIAAPVPARPLPAPALPPAPVAIERAPGAPLCDPAGCWVPDGDRLRHLPPAAVVPPGLCVPGPGLVYCP